MGRKGASRETREAEAYAKKLEERGYKEWKKLREKEEKIREEVLQKSSEETRELIKKRSDLEYDVDNTSFWDWVVAFLISAAIALGSAFLLQSYQVIESFVVGEDWLYFAYQLYTGVVLIVGTVFFCCVVIRGLCRGIFYKSIKLRKLRKNPLLIDYDLRFAQACKKAGLDKYDRKIKGLKKLQAEAEQKAEESYQEDRRKRDSEAMDKVMNVLGRLFPSDSTGSSSGSGGEDGPYIYTGANQVKTRLHIPEGEMPSIDKDLGVVRTYEDDLGRKYISSDGETFYQK